MVCGLDEVGRGALAGPVTAAGVILPKNHNIKGLDDSKNLSQKRRQEMEEVIKDKALCYEIKSCDSSIIDKYNVSEAVKIAMVHIVNNLKVNPEKVLVDGRIQLEGLDVPQESIEKGDERIDCIKAASILAKEYRDKLMKDLYNKKYPQYNFKSNVGYSTKEHRQALEEFGSCSIHRTSYNSVPDHNNNREGK